VLAGTNVGWGALGPIGVDGSFGEFETCGWFCGAVGVDGLAGEDKPGSTAGNRCKFCSGSDTNRICGGVVGGAAETWM